MKNIPSIRVIKESRLDAVIHTKTKREAIMLVKILGVDGERFYDENDFIECWDGHKENTCYRIRNGKVDQMDCVKFYQKINEEIYEFPDLFAEGGGVSIHDIPTSEWYNPVRLTFKNDSSIEALPNTSDIIRNTSDFCTGFRGGNIPKPVKIEVVKDRTKTVKDWVDSLSEACAKLGCTSFIMSLDEIKKMEEKKMPTKFTFYVKEGTRPDKKCNGLIPTMTTTVVDASGKKTTVTCDKADYSERQGVLEAIAQMACGGNFGKEYDKAVKKKKFLELHDRTCIYCGKVFDTVEEKQEHEAWHVERKKARRERYLLRKRAKEIAFEEQAQKMAKEMMGEQK